MLHSCSNQGWFISAWSPGIQIFQEFQVLYKGIPGITGIPGVPSIPGIPSLLSCPQDSVWRPNWARKVRDFDISTMSMSRRGCVA